jgi:hypothetical protein
MAEHAVITQEMVDDVKRRLGETVTPTTPFFNTEASHDTIRHFCDAVGDANPCTVTRPMPAPHATARFSPLLLLV